MIEAKDQQAAKQSVKNMIDRDSIEVCDMEYLSMEVAPQGGVRCYQHTGTVVIYLRDKDVAAKAATELTKAV